MRCRPEIRWARPADGWEEAAAHALRCRQVRVPASVRVRGQERVRMLLLLRVLARVQGGCDCEWYLRCEQSGERTIAHTRTTPSDNTIPSNGCAFNESATRSGTNL